MLGDLGGFVAGLRCLGLVQDGNLAKIASFGNFV